MSLHVSTALDCIIIKSSKVVLTFPTTKFNVRSKGPWTGISVLEDCSITLLQLGVIQGVRRKVTSIGHHVVSLTCASGKIYDIGRALATPGVLTVITPPTPIFMD